MFRAVISDTKAWKNSIDAIAALIDEGTLQIDEKGIKLRAMDPSQIALVDLELPSSSFEEYKVEKPVNIGIDFTELSKITKRSRAEDKIELSFVDIKFQEENILGMNVKEEVRAVFALDHLNNLLKASDPQSIILIKMRTDAPLRIEYAIGDGRVIYYLAPRIESV